MKILGISAYCTNASACIVIDGQVLAAAREEYFTRVKGDASFPSNATDFCLNHCGLQLKDLDAIVLHDKPLLRFERLLETHYAFAPRGIKSFLASMPVWIHEKVFLRSLINKELRKLRHSDPAKIKMLFSEHHLSHAAGAFYTSPLEEAAILVIDSVGEWATTSISHGHQSRIKIVKEMRYPHSLGLLYNSFTSYLGLKNCDCQENISAVAALGDEGAPETLRFLGLIKDRLVRLKPDGSILLNQEYFRYTTGSELIDLSKWQWLFQIPERVNGQSFNHMQISLACAARMFMEDAVTRLCKEASGVTGSENLCLAGDLVLDALVEKAAKKSGFFKKVYVQQSPVDDGAAMGAALAAQYLYFNRKREGGNINIKSCKVYPGPAYKEEEIIKAMEEQSLQYYEYRNENAMVEELADLVAGGKIIGLFRGRMEFGPRASGNRTILCRAGDEELKRHINTVIKGRKPFCPLRTIREGESTGNPFMRKLIKKLNEAIPGCLLWHTSMASQKEPLACSPWDAIRFFKNTGIDYLVMDSFLISKELNREMQANARLANLLTA